MSAANYSESMTTKAADSPAATTRPKFWAKLTRRLTRSEYAAGAAIGLACLLLFRATDSAARWIYPAVVVLGWSIWLLAIKAQPTQGSDATKPTPLPTPGRCRWCGLRPRASICGKRSDGGACEDPRQD